MERLFKRYLWVVDLLTVMLAAFFLAKSVGHLVVAGYLLDGTPQPMVFASLPAPPPTSEETFDDVVRRDVFCSSCAPAVPASASAPSSQPIDGSVPVKTSLPITYVGSFLCNDPEWSFASITNNVDHTAGVYRVGSPLPSSYGTVTDIEPARVVFATGGHLEYVPLIADATVAPSPPGMMPVRPASPLDADLEKGVHKINDYQYEIDRGLLEKVLSDTSILAQQVRVLPSIDPMTRKPNGFRLYGIRPGSIMAAIGLQNGDTLSAVNGNDISTPDKAFAVYSAVRSASMIALSISRNGQARELDYTIH